MSVQALLRSPNSPFGLKQRELLFFRFAKNGYQKFFNVRSRKLGQQLSYGVLRKYQSPAAWQEMILGGSNGIWAVEPLDLRHHKSFFG
jgi:hypothetical protein